MVVVVGNSQLKFIGISGLSVKWYRQSSIWWTYLIDKIGKGGEQIPNHGWLLSEEIILPSKEGIF